MLKEYKTQSLLCIGSGLFFCLFGLMLVSPGSVYFSFGQMIMLGGYALLVCGSFMYARGKGYSWWVGLWGVLGPLGLLVLYVLRDKSGLILKKRQKE